MTNEQLAHERCPKCGAANGELHSLDRHLRTDDLTTEPVQTDEVREVVERVDQFSIQERDDDMLIGERHWQFGWRCIARRPKMMTNAEWRPEAERIVAALERLSLPTEPSEDVVERAAFAMAEVIAKRHGDQPDYWMSDRRREEARAALRTITPDRIRGEAFDWLAANKRMEVHYHAPTYCDDDDTAEEWRVTKVSGPINDREWDTVGRGETPLDAILDAIRALKAPSK